MKSYSIYFLFIENSIVYIGVTSDIIRRLKEHVSDGRKFDSFRAIRCRSKDDAKRHEKHFIRKYRPLFNKQCTKPIDMLNNEAIYIKMPLELSKHATKFAKDRGGVSKLV